MHVLHCVVYVESVYLSLYLILFSVCTPSANWWKFCRLCWWTFLLPFEMRKSLKMNFHMTIEMCNFYFDKKCPFHLPAASIYENLLLEILESMSHQLQLKINQRCWKYSFYFEFAFFVHAGRPNACGVCVLFTRYDVPFLTVWLVEKKSVSAQAHTHGRTEGESVSARKKVRWLNIIHISKDPKNKS